MSREVHGRRNRKGSQRKRPENCSVRKYHPTIERRHSEAPRFHQRGEVSRAFNRAPDQTALLPGKLLLRFILLNSEYLNLLWRERLEAQEVRRLLTNDAPVHKIIFDEWVNIHSPKPHPTRFTHRQESRVVRIEAHQFQKCSQTMLHFQRKPAQPQFFPILFVKR